MPRRIPSLSCPALLAALGFLLPAAQAHAHRLVVDCRVLMGQKVEVTAMFSDPFRSFPARGAAVHVWGADSRSVAEGKTDEKGMFTFAYDKAEPLRVKVAHPDHEAEVTVPVEALNGSDKQNPAVAGERSESYTPRVISSAHDPLREGIKDMLIGVGFLLALAAFVLGVRNARRLRELKGPNGRQV